MTTLSRSRQRWWAGPVNPLEAGFAGQLSISDMSAAAQGVALPGSQQEAAAALAAAGAAQSARQALLDADIAKY